MNTAKRGSKRSSGKQKMTVHVIAFHEMCWCLAPAASGSGREAHRGEPWFCLTIVTALLDNLVLSRRVFMNYCGAPDSVESRVKESQYGLQESRNGLNLPNTGKLNP